MNVINSALKDGAFRRSSCDSQPFLGSQAAQRRGLPKLTRATLCTGFVKFRSVNVRMLTMSTRNAAEYRLRRPTVLVTNFADRARMASVVRSFFNESSAGPEELVTKLVMK